MKIAFLGDIALFENGMLKDGWENRLKKVEEILSGYDIVIANLEVPLTSKEKTFVCKGIHLRSDERLIPILQRLHVKGVCLANNHICDFGIDGMDDTKKLLEQAGISYFGINNQAWNYELSTNHIRFHGFCCYSTNGVKYIKKQGEKGVNPLTYTALTKTLEEDKRDKCLSVLSLHWGDEYSQLPNAVQVDLMHKLAKSYEFILHGHHAHVMQGIEKSNQSILAYNQGNFCFDECHSSINPLLIIRQSSINKESYILSVEINENHVTNWETIGIRYDLDGICIIDNKNKLQYLSSKIKYCQSSDYKKEALQMIQDQKSLNLARHDFKWIISKLNYYSIGAKLVSYNNKRKYKQAFEAKTDWSGEHGKL